jgi:hypothetical protein
MFLCTLSTTNACEFAGKAKHSFANANMHACSMNINCNNYYIHARFSVLCMQVKETYLRKKKSMQRIEERVSLLNAHSRQTHIAIYIYA